MTITTKYDIGQKVYYPTQEFIDDRGTVKRVVRELTIVRIRASAWRCVGDRIETGALYEFFEDGASIEEYLLFPTEEAAWEEHKRRERADDVYQDELKKELAKAKEEEKMK